MKKLIKFEAQMARTWREWRNYGSIMAQLAPFKSAVVPFHIEEKLPMIFDYKKLLPALA